VIKKAVIPSAGMGTRLLPATKEQPKEMLPIFVRNVDGELCLKPLLQIVFENLYDVGFREFGFITGRGKRSVEDHFTVDNSFVELLKNGNKLELVKELEAFYRKVEGSHVAFINQPSPTGFGDAVHRAKSFTGSEPFLVHAGDDLVISKKNAYLSNLIRVFEEHEASAVFCVEKVRDPRKYGVITGSRVANNLYRVKRVIEKPSNPPSNMAIVAVYAFNSGIYEAIEDTPPDASGEVQLTNAIQRLIDQNHQVYAVELSSEEKRLDIGTPQSYLKALKTMLRSNYHSS
jgi:UTP--glucose-1-phosphate uridylyltransferase